MEVKYKYFMKNTKIKVGIAGFGIVGQKRKNFIDLNTKMQVKALCDIRFNNDLSMIENEKLNYNYNKLEIAEGEIFDNKKDNIEYFRDYKNMILNADLDTVFVCLPNYSAADATILSLKKGLNVFCEKPPARNVAEVNLVYNEFKKNKSLKLKYGFNHRYHESVKKAHSIINSKKYGEIVGLRGVYGKSHIIPFGHGWRSKKKFAGGGILLDQGIHMLDLVRYFSGDYDEIFSFVDNNYWKHDVEDNAFVLMRNKKGQVASIHSTATQWQHRFRLEIILEEALMELSGILSGSKSYGSETLRIIERKNKKDIGSQEEKVLTFLKDNSWSEEINEFADCVYYDKQVKNGTIQEAMKAMKLIEKIYKSDKSWYQRFK